MQAYLSIALNPLVCIATNKQKYERLAIAEKSLKKATMLAKSFEILAKS